MGVKFIEYLYGRVGRFKCVQRGRLSSILEYFIWGVGLERTLTYQSELLFINNFSKLEKSFI